MHTYEKPLLPRAAWHLAIIILTLWIPTTTLATWDQNGKPIQLGPSLLALTPVADAEGGCYVGWMDFATNEVVLQRLDLAGEVQAGWPFAGVRIPMGSPPVYSIAILLPGSAGSVWAIFPHDPGTGANIRAQLIRPDSSIDFGPIGLLVADDTVGLYYPTAVVDGVGGFYAAWSTDLGEIRAQHIDSAGDPIGYDPVRGQLAATPGWTVEPKSALGSYYYVVWPDARNDNGDIYLQRLDGSAGVPTFTPINGYPIGAGPGVQDSPQISTDGFGGNAVVIWQDFRDDPSVQVSRVYAQRVNSNGGGLWGAGGKPTALPTGYVFGLAMQADLSGGLYIAMSGLADLSMRSTVQVTSIDGNGNVNLGWPFYGGVELVSEPYNGWYPVVGGFASDAAGGFYLTWLALEQSADRGWICHYTPDGDAATNWPAGGIELVRSDGYRSVLLPTLTSIDEVVVAWNDSDNGALGPGIFAQRLHPSGLSYAHDAQITALVDVADDEGGALRLTLAAAPADAGHGSPGVTGYNVWRQTGSPDPKRGASAGLSGDPSELAALALSILERAESETVVLTPELAQMLGLPAANWESVGFHAATGDASYELIVRTRNDATPSDPAVETFAVTTHTEISAWYTLTGIAAAASIDNRAPLAPKDVLASGQPGGILLQWTPNLETDLAGYAVYRGSTADFAVDPANRLGSTTQAQFTDPDYQGGFYYKVTALDRHENESPASSAVTGVGVLGSPSVAQMLGPWPNPMVSTSRISLRLPEAGMVRAIVYDLAGRRVKQLANEVRPAGEHWITFDGRDDSGNTLARGVYLIRVETSKARFERKMLLID